ncbi:uncharacterized protein DDB_G0283697-like [Ptychodera flava]|uniref:uncharacterized protein DDB_G0283697-like n=1 Tax=Ptychodera flava TaxID=63121 RepID=UPI00396A3667
MTKEQRNEHPLEKRNQNQSPRTPSNQEESDNSIDVSKASETEGGVQETQRLTHRGPNTLPVQGVCESDEDFARGEVDETEMPDSTTKCDADSVPGEDASGEGSIVTVTSSVTKDRMEEEDREKINGEETVCGDQNNSTDDCQLQAVGVTSGEQIQRQTEMEEDIAVNGHVEVCSSGDATTQNNPDSDEIVLEFTELSAPIGSDNEFDSSFGDQAPPTPGSFMPQDGDIDDLTSSQRESSCLYEDSEDGAIPDKDLSVETGVKVEHEHDVDEFDSMKETEYELSEGEILSSESDDEKEKEKRAATDRSKKSNEVRSHRRRKSQDRLDLKQSRRTSASSRNDLRSIIQKKKQTEQRRNSTSRRERNKTDVVKRTASRDRKSQIRPADRESHGRSVRDDERCRIRERSSESRKSMTDHHSDSRHRAGNGRSGGSGNIPRKESDKREGRSYTESGRNKAGVRDRDRAPSRRDSRHHRK